MVEDTHLVMGPTEPQRCTSSSLHEPLQGVRSSRTGPFILPSLDPSSGFLSGRLRLPEPQVKVVEPSDSLPKSSSYHSELNPKSF